MKYQKLVNKMVVKKTFGWFITILVLSLFKILFLKIDEFHGVTITFFHIESLLGFFNPSSFSILSAFIFLYHLCFVCYYTYLFINYEKENNPEFTFLRFTSKKWITMKIFIAISMIFFFKIFL